jgi:hypothetical protein
LFQLVSVPLELLPGLFELVVEVRAGGDVDDRGDHERATRSLHRRQADLNRELRSIAPASGELRPAAHRTGGRLNAIPRPVGSVSVGEARRHEALDRFSTELVG